MLERPGLPGGVEALLEILLGGLGEHDHPRPPLELVAVEPVQAAPERLGGEGERTAWIGEFGDQHLGHVRIVSARPRWLSRSRHHRWRSEAAPSTTEEA